MIEANNLIIPPPPLYLLYSNTFTATSGDLEVEFPQLQESVLNAINYDKYLQLKEDWAIFADSMTICKVNSDGNLVRTTDYTLEITFDENQQIKMQYIKNISLMHNGTLSPTFTSTGVILRPATNITVTQTMKFMRRL